MDNRIRMDHAKIARRWRVMMLFTGLAGCYGGVQEGGSGTGEASAGAASGEGETGGAHDSDEAADVAFAPPARVLRLDARAYLETVATLLHGRAADADADLPLPDVTPPFGWVNGTDRFSTQYRSYRISADDFSVIERNARSLAVEYIDQVAPDCIHDPGAESECHPAALAEAVSRLYRRPAADAELDALMELRPAEGGSTPTERFAVRMRAALMSPDFLFRSELGDEAEPSDASIRPLSPFELASALSYSIVQAPPDALLFAAAEDGSITRRDVLEDHVDRLLASPRHARRVHRFLQEYWDYPAAAGVPKDVSLADTLPEGTPGADAAKYVPEALVEHTDRLLEDIIASSLHRDFLATMLTTPQGYFDRQTAVFYNRQTESEALESTVFEDDERRGILMQPSWLIAYSEPDRNNPVRRGLFVQESLLCGEVPDLPIEGVPALEYSEDRSLREALEIHLQADGSCVACHQLMDPNGFPFEQFDLFGRHRTMEAGRSVDSRGHLAWSGGPFDAAGDVDTPFEMVTALAKSEHVERCFLRHALEFWAGREVEADDHPAIEAAAAAYRMSGGDFDAGLRALLLSPSFRYRTTE